MATHADERQAGIQTLEIGELFGVFAQVISDRIQDVIALGDIHAWPGALIERAARRDDGGVYFGRIRFLQMREHLLVGRIDDWDAMRAGACRHALPINQARDRINDIETTGNLKTHAGIHPQATNQGSEPAAADRLPT